MLQGMNDKIIVEDIIDMYKDNGHYVFYDVKRDLYLVIKKNQPNILKILHLKYKLEHPDKKKDIAILENWAKTVENICADKYPDIFDHLELTSKNVFRINSCTKICPGIVTYESNVAQGYFNWTEDTIVFSPMDHDDEVGFRFNNEFKSHVAFLQTKTLPGNNKKNPIFKNGAYYKATKKPAPLVLEAGYRYVGPVMGYTYLGKAAITIRYDYTDEKNVCYVKETKIRPKNLFADGCIGSDEYDWAKQSKNVHDYLKIITNRLFKELQLTTVQQIRNSRLGLEFTTRKIDKKDAKMLEPITGTYTYMSPVYFNGICHLTKLDNDVYDTISYKKCVISITFNFE